MEKSIFFFTKKKSAAARDSSSDKDFLWQNIILRRSSTTRAPGERGEGNEKPGTEISDLSGDFRKKGISGSLLSTVRFDPNMDHYENIREIIGEICF